MIQPDDEAGCVLFRVEAVARAETGDTEEGRRVWLREPLADKVLRLVLHTGGHNGDDAVALLNDEVAAVLNFNANSLEGEPVVFEKSEGYQIRKFKVMPEIIHFHFDARNWRPARLVKINGNVELFWTEQCLL